MNITEVKFRCTYRMAGGPLIAEAVFKLGEGPCGKTVDLLKVDVTEQGFEIRQGHTDETTKTFFYPWPQIVGRIEISAE